MAFLAVCNGKVCLDTCSRFISLITCTLTNGSFVVQRPGPIVFHVKFLE